MKKSIVLESPIVVSFDRGKTKGSPVRAARTCHLAPKGHLDRPPEGDIVFGTIEPRLAPEPARQQENSPQRILVVEDEAPIRHIYFNVLARCGFQVDMAEDGEAAWRALRNASLGSKSYDLLITDNTMPKLSGIELIQKLRTAHIELPVILASGTLPASTGWLRCAAILSKPFPLGLLVQTVREVLRVA